MSRNTRQQSVVSFSLSFLDILCCGLGAAVLLLLIVRYGETIAETDEQGLLLVQVTEIQQQIAIKQEKLTELERIAEAIRSQITAKTSEENATSAVSRLQAQRLSTLLQEVQRQRAALNKARQQLASAAVANQQKAKVATEQSSQQHLTGLMVNSDRVLVLLDRSASMLSDTLVEIIRLRASPMPTRANAKKWVSARGAVKWVVDELADGASYQVLTFSDEIHDARGKEIKANVAPGWEVKSAGGLPKEQMVNAIAQRHPDGPTNLKSALEAASRMRPLPAQIMLITDGYPTMPTQGRMRPLRNCHTSSGRSSILITPQCRLEVFKDARRMAERSLKHVRIDVILLPLEGDSNSIYGYWHLASHFGGRLLTPAQGWPTS